MSLTVKFQDGTSAVSYNFIGRLLDLRKDLQELSIKDIKVTYKFWTMTKPTEAELTNFNARRVTTDTADNMIFTVSSTGDYGISFVQYDGTNASNGRAKTKAKDPDALKSFIAGFKSNHDIVKQVNPDALAFSNYLTLRAFDRKTFNKGYAVKPVIQFNDISLNAEPGDTVVIENTAFIVLNSTTIILASLLNIFSRFGETSAYEDSDVKKIVDEFIGMLDDDSTSKINKISSATSDTDRDYSVFDALNDLD